MKTSLLAVVLLASTAAAATHPVKHHRRPAYRPARSHGRISKQKQPDKARTLEIQQALVQRGYLKETTGEWDRATLEALAQIAKEHDWQTCHIPDSHVLQVLGLGSDIAGMGEPGYSPKPSILQQDLTTYETQHPETCTLTEGKK